MELIRNSKKKKAQHRENKTETSGVCFCVCPHKLITHKLHSRKICIKPESIIILLLQVTNNKSTQNCPWRDFLLFSKAAHLFLFYLVEMIQNL